MSTPAPVWIMPRAVLVGTRPSQSTSIAGAVYAILRGGLTSFRLPKEQGRTHTEIYNNLTLF
jgi:hypothetical protein